MKAKTRTAARGRSRSKQKASIFKFAPHRHTGKKLAHHHTSYGGLFLILVLVGSLLFGIVQPALAQESDILKVDATVVTEPPVTVLPPDNSHFKDKIITVSGSCQPDFIVVILRNSYIAGSSPCNSDGRFSVPISLVSGRNVLTAQHYRPGPDSALSNQVTVFYDPPFVPPKPVLMHPATGQELLLTTDTAYQKIEVGQELSWPVSVTGAQPPYAVSWDWQDGTNDLLVWSNSGTYVNKHIYKKAGIYRVLVRLKDVTGDEVQLQLVVEVTGSTISSPAAVTTSPSPSLVSQIIWTSYATLVLLVVTFWIGERYELWFIHHHHKRRRPARV